MPTHHDNQARTPETPTIQASLHLALPDMHAAIATLNNPNSTEDLLCQAAADFALCVAVAGSPEAEFPEAAMQSTALKSAFREARPVVGKAMEYLAHVAKTKEPELLECLERAIGGIPNKASIEERTKLLIEKYAKTSPTDFDVFRDNGSASLQKNARESGSGVMYALYKTPIDVRSAIGVLNDPNTSVEYVCAASADLIVCTAIGITEGIDIPLAIAERIAMKSAFGDAGAALVKPMERVAQLAKTQGSTLLERVEEVLENLPGKIFIENNAKELVTKYATMSAADLAAFQENPSTYLQNIAIAL